MSLILALIMLKASGNYLLLCSLTSSSVTTSGFDGSYTGALGFLDSRILGPGFEARSVSLTWCCSDCSARL